MRRRWAALAFAIMLALVFLLPGAGLAAANHEAGDGFFYYTAGEENRAQWCTAQALWALRAVKNAGAGDLEAVNRAVYGARSYLQQLWAARGGATGGDWDWTAVALAGGGTDLSGYLADRAAGLLNQDPATMPTTELARLVLTVAQAGGNPEAFGGQNLIAALEARQVTNPGSPHYGHFGNLVYSSEWGFRVDEHELTNAHVWSVLALAAAGREIPEAGAARAWLTGARNPDGGWGYAAEAHSDPDTTAQVLRALAVLGASVNDDAVQNGFLYIRSLQNPADGGIHSANFDKWPAVVYNGPSNTASNAEALQAAAAFDYWESWILDILTNLLSLQAVSAPAPEEPVAGQPGGSSSGPAETFTVLVEVRGAGGSVMYPLRSVVLGPGSRTPLGALRALGASVSTKYGGSYVAAIDGLAEGQHGVTSGWMYSVNDTVPPVAADSYQLARGDAVKWFYVTALPPEVPENPQNQVTDPKKTDATGLERTVSPAAREALAAFGPAPRGEWRVTVLGEDILTSAEREELARLLAGNRVSLAVTAGPDRAVVIGDAMGEVTLFVAAGALAGEVTLTVVNRTLTEMESEGARLVSPAFRPVSPVYVFGPAGLVFREPVILAVKYPGLNVENARHLSLAVFDRGRGGWVLMPTVADLTRSELLALVEHFSWIGVVTRRPHFTDVTNERFGWARESVVALAERGVIGGVAPGLFAPERPVTRAELCAMLVRLFDPQPPAGTPARSFDDIPPGAWYAADVDRAAQSGFVAGRPGGRFYPQEFITRQEMVTLLVRAAGIPGAAGDIEASLQPYADAGDVSAWARGAVAAALGRKLVVGVTPDRLDPHGLVNRAQAAVFLERLARHQGK
ncbi:MAG: S-layer homology domain-containing protein [Bacillota bacterium]